MKEKNKGKKTRILSKILQFFWQHRFRKYDYSNTQKRANEKFGQNCHRWDRNLPLKVGSCCFKCIVNLLILFFKLSVRTFYKVISKFQQKVQS